MESKNIGSLHVNITGDDSDLQKALENSEKELNKATESVREFGTNIGVLRAEYKKLSKESFAGKTPQEIEAIEMRLASLRDEIGDYDARIKSLSADPFQKGAEAVSQLSTMLAGAAGAATLFGGSEEKLNQLMQKTIALIAIAQAAQTAADFTKQNAIGIFIKEKYAEIAARTRETLLIRTNTAATVAETGAKAGLTAVQKILVTLQNAWNKAVMGFPLMWIVAGLATLALAAWELSRTFGENARQTREFNAELLNLQNRSKELSDWHQFESESAKTAGKSEKELNDLRVRQISQRIALIENEIVLLENKSEREEEQTKRLFDLYDELIKYKDELILVDVQNQATSNKLKEDEIKKQREFADKMIQVQTELYGKLRQEFWANHRSTMEANRQNWINELNEKKYWQVEAIKNIRSLANEEMEIQDVVTDKYIEEFNKRKAFSDEISDTLNKSFEAGLEDLTVAFAESTALLASGETNMQGVFKSIGEVLANFMSSLGKALIATGIASDAFKKTLKNPYAAIAAGAALVALSSIVASKLQAGPSGGASYASTSTSASSGGVSDSGISYRTIFANDNQMKLVGELRAEGSVLVASLYNENKRITN